MSENELDSVKVHSIPRYMNVCVVVLNVLLLFGAFLLYGLYVNAYGERLKKENISNITNLNRSAAINTTKLFESYQIKVNDITGYIEQHNPSYEEVLAFIDDTNSSDARCFEVIGTDFTGHLAQMREDGTYEKLDYRNNGYAALQRIFRDRKEGLERGLWFAPEYTDGATAMKMLALYGQFELTDEENQKSLYTLLLATESRNVHDLLNGQKEYSGQSTVLLDADGNYIVGNRDYKSTNFFQYLYVYNELSLDQRNAIKEEMTQQKKGQLYYKNASVVVEDCVFCYEKMQNSDWFCVTCVPLSSFHKPVFNATYLLWGVLLLLTLLVVDVVWLRRINFALKQSVRREMEASQAKGSFMSRMSHEIRTPLNAIIGYNTIAENELAGVSGEVERKQAEMKVLDCLMKSEIASRHLLTLINDVLDMSAIESGKVKVAHERFDFKGLITSLTTVFYSQAQAKGVEFEVIFNTLTEEWFVGDQTRTNQILTNLLSNAVKFTSGGGSVKLIITQPEADTNASHIHFEVVDTGIGMTKEYLTHIWTPFEQADSSISRRFGGTGLGLSITKNLVDIMGGTITVESTLGVGTSFGVDLTFERTEQPDHKSAYDFSSVNALVVDDDQSTCDYVRMMFNRCGASCAAVTSGAEAIRVVQTSLDKGEHFSICLVDWKMPHMDGIETIREMRKILGDKVPITVLTAYDYTTISEEAAAVGVSQFLTKPFFQSSLLDLLLNTSGGQAPQTMERNIKFDFTGKHVLLAEDNFMNMEIAKKILESVSLTVDGVWNGKEAVERFVASECGYYCAILMDVHMPELNGHDAAKQIRLSSHKEAKTIPIIAMTADAFAENVAEAYEAGMNAHISKPINVQMLLNTLKQYMKRSEIDEVDEV